MARVRLDIVAMLLHRKWFAAATGGDRYAQVSSYVFADASPQWRGSELFAASLETVDFVGRRWQDCRLAVAAFFTRRAQLPSHEAMLPAHPRSVDRHGRRAPHLESARHLG